MRWWKRLVFSIISLVWGYISLDYLYYAFSKLVNSKGSPEYYVPESDGLYQLIGLAMFLLWFSITAGYLFIIKKSSNQVDIIEEDYKTGRQTYKKKWADIVLQVAFIITGLILRWGYVVYIYIPDL